MTDDRDTLPPPPPDTDPVEAPREPTLHDVMHALANIADEVTRIGLRLPEIADEHGARLKRIEQELGLPPILHANNGNGHV